MFYYTACWVGAFRRSSRRSRATAFAVAVFAACLAVGAGATAAAEPDSPLPMKQGEVFVVEDYDNKVTSQDLGFNYFAGNTGLIESTGGMATQELVLRAKDDWCLRFAFDFRDDGGEGAFAGIFNSLFGLTDTLISLDGSGREPRQSHRFPDYSLDTTDLYRGLPGFAGRRIDQMQLDVRSLSAAALTLRFELKDENDNVRFCRRTLEGDDWQTLSLRIPRDFLRGSAFDWSRLSMLTIVVERRHVADGVSNPNRGAVLLDNLRLVDLNGRYPDLAAARGRDEYDRAFLEYVRALTFLHFVDFAGTDPRCGGLIQDRATFADLLSVGGGGFQLSAYVIGAENGYLTRADAARKVHRLLKSLREPGIQGPKPVGTVGYRGFLYHFLGVDGRRKQNFDFTATRDVDESANTVELSTIDTALFLCGAITAAAYFDSPSDPTEIELRRLTEELYADVDWPFMLDRRTNQFILGWKPREERASGAGGGNFLLPDAEGLGYYASKKVDGRELPATLDYYTDEGLLIALLAIASPNKEHRVDPSVFFSMYRQGTPFVKTYPGSLFTYQFAGCWLDTERLGSDRDPAGKAPPVDYFQNTRSAIQACIQYAATRPAVGQGDGSLHWGLSACEGPFDQYFAEAAPPLALATVGGSLGPDGAWHEHPLERGILTVYGVGSSLQHCPRQAIAGLWECERLGLLHPRFGFADAYSLDVSAAWIDSVVPGRNIVRNGPRAGRGNQKPAGPWCNRCGFAIDNGPMLIVIDNYLNDRFIPRLFMRHAPIRKALATLFPETEPEPTAH